MPDPSQLGRTGAVGLWLASFVFALVSWFVFVGKLGWDELIVALVCAAIAASASQLVWSQHAAAFRDHSGKFLQMWRLPKYMITGSWEIFSVLLRQLFGGKRAESLVLQVPYDPVSDDPGDAALRALAIAYTTSTPNFVVIGIDRERGRLVYHQIKRSPVLPMTVKLGARP
jgi:multisubunit Na+/H+ antiporter MnhE subunit